MTSFTTNTTLHFVLSFKFKIGNLSEVQFTQESKTLKGLVAVVKCLHSEYGLFMELHKKPERKFRTSTGFEPVSSRSNQLSYEVTYVGSWSIISSCSRERDECGKIMYVK